MFQGLWAIVHSAAWIALGECEWIPQTVLKRTVDINFLSVVRLSQVDETIVKRKLRKLNLHIVS